MEQRLHSNGLVISKYVIEFCKCFFKLIVLIYLIQVYRLVNEDFKVNWVGLTNDHLKHKEKEFRAENPNLIYEPKIESSFMNSLVVEK